MNVVFAELSEGGVMSTDVMSEDDVTVVEIDYNEAAENAEYAVRKIGEMRVLQITASGDKHITEACDRVMDELIRIHSS